MELTSKEFSSFSSSLSNNGKNMVNEFGTSNIDATPSPENSHPTLNRIKQVIISFLIVGLVFASNALGSIDSMNKLNEMKAMAGISNDTNPVAILLFDEGLGAYGDENNFDAGLARESLLNIFESITTIKKEHDENEYFRKLMNKKDFFERSGYEGNPLDDNNLDNYTIEIIDK